MEVSRRRITGSKIIKENKHKTIWLKGVNELVNKLRLFDIFKFTLCFYDCRPADC